MPELRQERMRLDFVEGSLREAPGNLGLMARGGSLRLAHGVCSFSPSRWLLLRLDAVEEMGVGAEVGSRRLPRNQTSPSMFRLPL